MDPTVNTPMDKSFFSFLFVFLIPLLSYGQNNNGKESHYNLKRLKYHHLSVTDTSETTKLTDYLRYVDGYAPKKSHKIVPCFGREEELIAMDRSFGISLQDFCFETGQLNPMLCEEQGDNHLMVRIRCWSDAGTYIGALSKLPTKYCTPECYAVLSQDTVMAYYYEPIKSVTVVRFFKKGNRYVMDNHPIETVLDECGVVHLLIPKHEVSYYAFYNSSPYLCWIHFIPNDTSKID